MKRFDIVQGQMVGDLRGRWVKYDTHRQKLLDVRKELAAALVLVEQMRATKRSKGVELRLVDSL